MFMECEFSDGEREGASESSVRRPGMRGRIILFWAVVNCWQVQGDWIMHIK